MAEHSSLENAVLNNNDFLLSVLESGFISSVLLRNEEDSEWDSYKNILGIEETHGYIMAIECAQKTVKNNIQEVNGTEIKEKKLLFYTMIHKYFSNAIIGSPFSRRLFLCIPVRDEKGEYSGQIQSINDVSRMAGEIETKTGFAVKVGIGNIQVMERLRVSCKEAVLALKQTLNKVMHIDMMYEFPSCEISYPFETEEEIFLAVRRGEVLQVREGSEKFFDWMVQKEGKLNDSIRLKCLEFVLRAERIGYFEGGETYYFDSREEYLSNISAVNTLPEMEKWFLEKMQDAAVNIGQPTKEIHRGLVGQAERYVEQNLGQEIKLRKIAEEINVNASYLSRLFKEETGSTFVDYLMRRRIARAEKLLRGTEKSIKEIGAECGYASQNYFGRVFKKITGIPPAEYRKIYMRTMSDSMHVKEKGKK